MKYSELKQKEVINLCDGKRLGCINDIIIDNCGKLEAIIVPGQTGLLSLIKSSNDIIIPWCRIIRLGEDVILVDITENHPKLNN